MITASDRTLTVNVSPEQSERAVQIAAARMKGHAHCRRPHEEIGPQGSGNWLADWIGALGEVVVVDLLRSVGLNPAGWIAVGKCAPTGADFTIGALACDVKATPPGKAFWNINNAQFEHRTTDLYIPVQFTSPDVACIYKAVSAATVARWPVRTGSSAYRGCAVNQLQPIRSIEELFG